MLLRKAILESKVAPINRNSSAFLLHITKTFSNFELFSIFSQTFFGTNFRHENKSNVVETISCFVYQLSKKYYVYYVSEHLKYCLQIKEYWLNKNACLNTVLGEFCSVKRKFCSVSLLKFMDLSGPWDLQKNYYRPSCSNTVFRHCIFCVNRKKRHYWYQYFI